MMRTILYIFFLFNFLLSNDLEIENIFDKYNLEGTFVLSSLDNKNYVFNEKRAIKRFTPASTFKIPHTLIALEENIITENSTIKWDGKKRFYEPWNKDQTLKSAIKYSCVWCFQLISQEISTKSYLDYLKKINYGNKKIGKIKNSFWLDGSLKISAYEQINFLKKLYKNNLAFGNKNLILTKKLLIKKKFKNYNINGKTGWSKNIGWYVGYLKTENQVWFFALNGNIKKINKLKLRELIVEEVLNKKIVF